MHFASRYAAFISVAALCLGLTACSDRTTDTAKQINREIEASKSISDPVAALAKLDPLQGKARETLNDCEMVCGSIVKAVRNLNDERMTRIMQSMDKLSASELATITKHFETQMTNLEAYVDEQLRVAEGYRASRENEMEASGAMIWKPSATKPSMEMVVEAYSPFSMRALGVLNKFDRAMDHFDFMVWNAIRDQSDVNEEVNRFLRKFQPLAIRCYTTHLRLMTTVRKI